MAARRAVNRVEMSSPSAPGSAFVPESRVKEFEKVGWRLAEPPKTVRRGGRKKADEGDDE